MSDTNTKTVEENPSGKPLDAAMLLAEEISAKPKYKLKGRISRNGVTQWREVGSQHGHLLNIEQARDEFKFYSKLKEEDYKHGWDGLFVIIEVNESVITHNLS